MTKTIDPFELVVIPAFPATIHNVLLVDVRQADDGHAVLTIEHQGATRDLPGGGRWSEFILRDVGRMGCLVPMMLPHEGEFPNNVARLTASGCHFYPYLDPTLRRMVELDHVDVEGKARAGWVCDDRPGGFTAPVGLIPGEHGQFMPDETIEVTLRVPPEFVRECRRVQRTPLELLRGFVGDAAGIQNYSSNPRADGYCSHGSDERDMAGDWIQRAYGMDAVDIFKAEAQDYERAARQDDLDDIDGLLDDFVRYGGQAPDLIKAIQELVTKQARIGDEQANQR